jgi:hypothetical protein
MLLPVLRGLLRLGWAQQMSRAALEVPWHQKRVDLALSSSGFGVITIELKVSKWRHAIDQAYVNRWVSASSWVGLWHECITNDTYRYARETEVGLLAVTGRTVYPLVWPGPAPRPGGTLQLEPTIAAAGFTVRDLLSREREARLALA